MFSSPNDQTTSNNRNSDRQNNNINQNTASSSSSSSSSSSNNQQQQSDWFLELPILSQNQNNSKQADSNRQHASKSAFDWDVYKNRKTALQHLKRNCTLVDTILETEDGSAYEFVHSQVISAFGDKLNDYINQNGNYVQSYNPTVFQNKVLNNNNKKSPLVGGCSNPSVQQSGLNQEQALKSVVISTSAGAGKNVLELPQQSYWSRWPGQVKLIRLPKVNKYTLRILVECAYTGYIRTDLPSGGIWQILAVADHYDMNEIGLKHRHQLQRCAWHKIRANFKYVLAENIQRQVALTNQMLTSKQTTTIRQHQHQQGASARTSNLLLQSSSQPTNQLQKEAYQSNHNHRQVSIGSAQNNHQAATGSSDDEEMTPMMPARDNNDNIEINNNNNNLATIKYEHFEALLLHDKLNIDNEETVWHAIKFWCNYDLPGRASKLASLLPCMRFPRFKSGTNFSARFIWQDELIMNNNLAQHQLAVLDRNHRDYLTGSSYSKQRDGFSLPCALNPRQLRPRVPHSILLAIGGWQQGHPTRLIESYDSNCNLWFESKKKIMLPLAYHGIECINGLLYICGGTDGNEILNELFTFNPVNGDCFQKSSMRESRCYVSTAHLDNNLFAMGGHSGSQRMKSAERFNLIDQFWHPIHDMNVARSDASACVHEALIYIAGGLNDQVIESSVEFYNNQDDTWTFVASMITPRTSFTLLLYNNNTLLAIGGNNGTERLSSVEQYNFATKTWSQHSNMRHRRSTFSAAVLDENKLIVVGGYNGQTPFNQVEMFEQQSASWITLQKIRYDRSGLKVIVVSDLPNGNEYTFLGSAGQNNSSTGTYTGSASASASGSGTDLSALTFTSQEDNNVGLLRPNNLLNRQQQQGNGQVQSPASSQQQQQQQQLSLTARARHRFLRSIGRLPASPDRAQDELQNEAPRARRQEEQE